MTPNKAFTLALALAGLCSGCVGTGPNTQQGAVLGAAGGALVGGIVGNNSRHGDTLGGALIGAAAAGVAGGVIGNSVDQQRGTVYTTPAANTEYVVQQPPPPPPPPRREVVVARPAREAVWVEGYYAYTGRGNEYAWVPGHWEVPPPRAHAYVRPRWERRDNGYVYVRGYWQ
ncbi:MAG TPA: glycine zipper domain-containing protein [Opitutaceae bacterium]|nr:glycine zipper domain-containing protein [Opitutaceae bacterium]